jgi:glycosyltransferase involved in cell wall biosynthesis
MATRLQSVFKNIGSLESMLPLLAISRIRKYYRRDSIVIYPPVDLPPTPEVVKEDYYLITSRIVGAKGLDLAVQAAIKLNLKLKIIGEPAGYYTEYQHLKKISGNHVEFLGRLSDEDRNICYAKAKAFLALAVDEDFGITPVESMHFGTPVIAFRGGGYLESVVEDKTGVFFNEPTVESLVDAIKRFEKLKLNPSDCIIQANKFSQKIFSTKIKKLVSSL